MLSYVLLTQTYLARPRKFQRAWRYIWPSPNNAKVWEKSYYSARGLGSIAAAAGAVSGTTEGEWGWSKAEKAKQEEQKYREEAHRQ